MRLRADLEPIPLKSVKVDGNEITLETSLGVEIVFNFEDKDRMYFSIPILGKRIYYQRQITPSGAQSNAHQTPPTKHQLNATTVSTLPQLHQALNRPEPTPQSERAVSVSPDFSDHPSASPVQPLLQTRKNFARALDSMQKNRIDETIRALSAALQNTEIQWKDIENEPAFAQLTQDPRLEIL